MHRASIVAALLVSAAPASADQQEASVAVTAIAWGELVVRDSTTGSTKPVYHRSLGLRWSYAPLADWWAYDAVVEREESGPVTFSSDGVTRLFSGPWLRGEIGVRAQTGIETTMRIAARIGLQQRRRQVVTWQRADLQSLTVDTPADATMSLSFGVERRPDSETLIGIDLVYRRAYPSDEYSLALVASVGRYWYPFQGD